MRSISDKTIIAIDRGASFTDFGVVSRGEMVKTLSLEKRDWKTIAGIYEDLNAAYRTDHAVFSGCATGMPDDMLARTSIIAEIDAIGFGGAALAGCSDCIVVSMGTGSAIVHFADHRARHVGGTGVGGGTIKGLASLICGSDDPLEIEALALKGNASKTSLTIADLGYEEISFLGADMTASNFARVQTNSREDLAAGILRLVGETVGIIASICARESNCRDRIVMVGKVAGNRFIRQVLELVGKLYGTKFLFPEHPGFATVYGAALKYRYDLEAAQP
jgi:type II pantothenate kinase